MDFEAARAVGDVAVHALFPSGAQGVDGDERN